MFSIKFDLSRSTTIAKSIDTVFNTLSDFNTWRRWSPWLCQETDCPVDIKGTPGQIEHEQSWDGKRIGSGRMVINHIIPNQRLDFDLFFLSPWKSHSKVSFCLKAEGEQTSVTWTMNGTIPIFLFFMKKMMSALVGSDYERGLSMLKDYLETGKVLSEVEVNDTVNQDGFWYVGKSNACPIEQVGGSMEEVFSALEKDEEANKLGKPEFKFSFYHKWDFVHRRCEYTSGYGYKKPIESDVPQDYVQGEVIPHRALNVRHKGVYAHLGNAWSTIMGCQRSYKMKALKKVPMYEIYETMPGEVKDEEIKTSIYLPVK